MKSKEAGFTHIFDSYYAPFCIYAKRYIDDMAVCENLVSDVFVTLWERKDDFDFESKTIISYIKVSVKNACLNYLRRLNTQWNYEEYTKLEGLNYDFSPEAVYTLNELYKKAHEILDNLPKRYRESFTKEFYEGKNQEEIAKELQISTKTVYRYKIAVLEKLRKTLRDYLHLF